MIDQAYMDAVAKNIRDQQDATNRIMANSVPNYQFCPKRAAEYEKSVNQWFDDIMSGKAEF